MFSTLIWRFWIDSRSFKASRELDRDFLLVEAREARILRSALELAHVRAHVLGDEEGDVLGMLAPRTLP